MDTYKNNSENFALSLIPGDILSLSLAGVLDAKFDNTPDVSINLIRAEVISNYH
jgi:hypothetical protein